MATPVTRAQLVHDVGLGDDKLEEHEHDADELEPADVLDNVRLYD